MIREFFSCEPLQRLVIPTVGQGQPALGHLRPPPPFERSRSISPEFGFCHLYGKVNPARAQEGVSGRIGRLLYRRDSHWRRVLPKV